MNIFDHSRTELKELDQMNKIEKLEETLENETKVHYLKCRCFMLQTFLLTLGDVGKVERGARGNSRHH